MKFENISKNEDGTMTFDVKTSPEEVAWLVDYAVGDLLREGVIAVNGLGDQEIPIRSNAH